MSLVSVNSSTLIAIINFLINVGFFINFVNKLGAGRRPKVRIRNW